MITLWFVCIPLKSNLETTHDNCTHSLERVRRHLVQASNVLVTVNSAVNFLVYCMISQKFRELLVRHCCWCTSTASSSSVSRRHAEYGCCCSCSRARRWWRRSAAGHDSWRQSDTNDSKRSATASNHSEPRSPRSNLTSAPFTLRVAHHHHHHHQQQQQQLMEIPQMMK